MYRTIPLLLPLLAAIGTTPALAEGEGAESPPLAGIDAEAGDFGTLFVPSTAKGGYVLASVAAFSFSSRPPGGDRSLAEPQLRLVVDASPYVFGYLLTRQGGLLNGVSADVMLGDGCELEIDLNSSTLTELRYATPARLLAVVRFAGEVYGSGCREEMQSLDTFGAEMTSPDPSAIAVDAMRVEALQSSAGLLLTAAFATTAPSPELLSVLMPILVGGTQSFNGGIDDGILRVDFEGGRVDGLRVSNVGGRPTAVFLIAWQ